MSYRLHYQTLLLCAIIKPLYIYPELLILRKTEFGFMPLENSNAALNNSIGKILCTYQWPMCITAKLSPEEQDALLTPGKPQTEEEFIQKQIRQKAGDATLAVIFIPTALYELFVILHAFTKNNNPLSETIKKLLSQESCWEIDLANQIRNDAPQSITESTQVIRNKINDRFKKANSAFYDGDKNLYSYLNQELGSMLLKTYPEFAKSETSNDLSNRIKNKADAIASSFVSQLIEELNFEKEKEEKLCKETHYFVQLKTSKLCTVQSHVKKLIRYLEYEKTAHFIPRIITLEYEARQLNKGILLRGTSLETFEINNTKKVLAGNTLRISSRPNYIMPTLQEAYAENLIMPYSISFGNSLFGGALTDETACTYNFLHGTRTEIDPRSNNKLAVAGYALFIDKKEYLQNGNKNLFFIAPLATLTALFQTGEFFHSRTKVALPKKTAEVERIKGLEGNFGPDKADIFLISRDPLEHAALFSEYLAGHSNFILKENTEEKLKQYQSFEDNTKAVQNEAAHYYKAIKKYHEELEEKKRAKQQHLKEQQEAFEHGIESIRDLYN